MSKIVNFRMEEEELEKVDNLIKSKMIDRSELLRSVLKYIKNEESLNKIIDLLNLNYDENFINFFLNHIENLENDLVLSFTLKNEYNDYPKKLPFEISEKNIKDIYFYINTKFKDKNFFEYISKNKKNIIQFHINKVFSKKYNIELEFINIKISINRFKGLNTFKFKNKDVYDLKDNIINNYKNNKSTCNIFAGPCGTGKTTLLINLLKDLQKEFNDYKILHLYSYEKSFLDGVIEIQQESNIFSSITFDFIIKSNIDCVYIEEFRSINDLEFIIELNKRNISVFSTMHSNSTINDTMLRLDYLSKELTTNQNISNLNILTCNLEKNLDKDSKHKYINDNTFKSL